MSVQIYGCGVLLGGRASRLVAMPPHSSRRTSGLARDNSVCEEVHERQVFGPREIEAEWDSWDRGKGGEGRSVL
jgi:hypothetical protein